MRAAACSACFFERPSPVAVLLAPHRHPGGEALGVVGAFGRHRVRRQLVEAAGGQLLEPGLEVVAAGTGRGLRHALAQQVHDQRRRVVPPPVEVDGADHRLHGVGQDRRLLPPAGRVLALAQAHRLAQTQLGRGLGQGARVHHCRPHLGQVALRQVGVGAVEVGGDHQPEDAVAQELEALVRQLARALGAPGAVAEGARQQFPIVERTTEPLNEGFELFAVTQDFEAPPARSTT